MSAYEYGIALVSSPIPNLETLIGSVPSGVNFSYFSTVRVGGNGQSVGDGYPSCEWQFDILTWTDMNTMLDFLGGDEYSSAAVYITTRRPDNTYDDYSAIMHRPRVPDSAKQSSGAWLNVTFRFTHLEVVP